MTKKILVLGSTGLLGKAVTQRFIEEKYKVRILVRNPDKASALFPFGVEIVKGDAQSKWDLKKALQDIDYVHISLSYPAEGIAVKHLISLLPESGIKKISYVSGSTVKAENTFHPYIAAKYESEQWIQKSGVGYQIFKPTLFYETLENFVNNGRASILGPQKKPYHLASANKLAALVCQRLEEKKSSVEFVFGENASMLNEALTAYCQKNHPEIEKVSHLPYFMANAIALLSRNKALKETARFFKYLERVGENYQAKAATVV
jgi:nucleoside-diphosphate-sugar epimerase